MSISVSQLSKNYGNQKAVNNISFSLGKGEIVGFLGPNGAGKSTTMKMITGYLAADSGKISVCDMEVAENNIATKGKIGYLPEANPLYTEMYVREYLQFIANVHQVKNSGETIEALIKTVGLTTEAHKKIGQLSKGYKQRVGLAAALVHDPEVLILDEPTSGLDPNQIIEIRNVIRSLAQSKTILFSSHIMQEVEALCDRVIIINKGNIVADGTLSSLQKNNKGKPVVRVAFEQQIAEAFIHEVPGAISVSKAAGNSWEIETADAEALKKELLQWSVSNNLDIVSLQTETKNLEAVFKSLTT
ncbi:MAG: gldA [Ferruginibacter sp.]|nr:gldA [Ferruginibacter sp.]